MDIVVLRTFIAAAATGSFSAAAERVNASPSSVTERIKQLEYQLGARLFDRNKRGCSLTQSGVRFLSSAQNMVRSWDFAKQTIGLPDRFTQSLSIGGQYFFWDSRLMDWLPGLQKKMPDLALRVIAGASARLNRELVDGLLDVAMLYDPVFHRSLRSEPIFPDELVLVTGGVAEDWESQYVQIEWGEAYSRNINARLPNLPKTGLILDLGVRSADILIEQQLAGFLPALAAEPLINKGQLTLIEDAPRFEFPAYICWHRDLDSDLVEAVAAHIKQSLAGVIPAR